MLLLALLLAALGLGVATLQAARIQALERRLATLEPQPERPLLVPGDGGLQGLRVALDVRQDHPNPVFAGLLRDALAHEGAIVDEGGEVTVRGEVVGNGYADVYYRADLTVSVGPETLFTMVDKPPHGDRPANLALETVQRLKTEWAKRERQGALRELGR